jgi:lipid-A-disaccharide synthase-like uncharacterized protein
MKSPFEVAGWAGQALFGARVLLQWIASERARRSVVPRRYWELSLAASGLVLVYAFAVKNLVFQLSLVPGAVTAARNLFLGRSRPARALLPWAAALVLLVAWTTVSPPQVGPPLWAAVGISGSLLWGLRVVAQWWVSERRGRSTLPPLFWALSLVGSALLLAYAVYRRDAVMIAGYALGAVPYARNLVLLRRAVTAGARSS